MTVTAGFPLKVAMRVLGLMVSTEFSALCAFGLRSKPTPRIVELFVAFSAEDVIITQPFFMSWYFNSMSSW